jgi:hypothetical protein
MKGMAITRWLAFLQKWHRVVGLRGKTSLPDKSLDVGRHDIRSADWVRDACSVNGYRVAGI